MREEWNTIWHSTWLKVVLAAIIVIPAIYSGVFLGSMWDPYGNTENIPVAIVNEDIAVSYDGKDLNIGEDLAKELEQQTSMKFQVVDEAIASKGLQDGSYYMIITIPKDFSAHATTLLNQTPEKMQLEYTTNPGSNYIATKMDESAMQKIKAQVSETVTKTYADTLFSKIGILSEGLQDASVGSHDLSEGLTTAKQGSASLEEHLQTLANSTLSFQEGTDTLVNGLSAYTSGVASITEGSEKLDAGLASLQSNGTTLVAGTSQLYQGAQSVSSGIDSYTKAVGELNQGASLLNRNQSKLVSGVQQLGSAASSLDQGASTLLSGLQSLSTQLSDNMKQTAPLLQQLQTANTQSVDQLQQLSQQASALKQQITNLQAANTQTIKALKSIQPADEASRQTLQALITQYQAVDYSNLETMLDTLSTQSVSLQNLVTSDSQMITALSDAVSKIQQSIDPSGSSTDQIGILQGMTTLSQGLSQLDQQVNEEQGLVQGVSDYTNGVATLTQGIAQVDEHSTTLQTGASQIAGGLQTMNQSTPSLMQGIEQLHDGSTALLQGSTQLCDNSSALTQGASDVAEGSTQLHDGAIQLHDGSTTLRDGLTTLTTGGQTLESALSDGATQSKLTINESTIDMLASPVTLDHQEISSVENNGHAMAPYMMSVGLYVACMAFTLMYPLLKNSNKTASGLRLWRNKAGVMYCVSTCMAIVMVTALICINGMAPSNIVQTYLMAILIGAAFMSMIVFLSITCGKIGSFLVLVFMVFQLGGAAGTYPIETSNDFYQAIHPYMPFSYSVEAFRHTLSTGGSLQADCMVFIMMIVVFSVLSILFYKWKVSVSEEQYDQSVLAKLQ